MSGTSLDADPQSMFKRFAIATVVIWLAASAALIYLSSAAVMSGPREGELYVYSWSYQIVTRVFVFGPMFVAALAAILLSEWAIATIVRRRRRRV